MQQLADALAFIAVAILNPDRAKRLIALSALIEECEVTIPREPRYYDVEEDWL